MIRKPVKDGLGNNVRDHIFNYAENRFEHIDDLVHESSSDVKAKEPKIGSREHKFKNPEKYVSTYTSSLEQAAFPIPGTAPSEVAAAKKIINENGPVKYDKNGYPDKATPEQFAAAAYRLERHRQMTGEPDKPKPKLKKINPFSEIEIPIPTVNYSLLRDPKQEERESALEKMRVRAFTSRPDEDAVRGIGSLTNSTVKKLKAARSLRKNKAAYKSSYVGSTLQQINEERAAAAKDRWKNVGAGSRHTTDTGQNRTKDFSVSQMIWRNSATSRGARDWSNQSSTFKGQGYSEPPSDEKEEINYIWSEPKIKDPGADYKPGKFPKLDEAIRNAKSGKR